MVKVAIQFDGGVLDGTVTIDPDGEPPADVTDLFAWRFYQLTGGEEGKAAAGISPAALAALEWSGPIVRGAVHKYRVVERRDEWDGYIFVRAELSN